METVRDGDGDVTFSPHKNNLELEADEVDQP